ncbi:hypothetical protein evm_007227 [Chilo suppressalis]|nr:hypothetical protein evm_007227 [Chilo suppressalis]
MVKFPAHGVINNLLLNETVELRDLNTGALNRRHLEVRYTIPLYHGGCQVTTAVLCCEPYQTQTKLEMHSMTILVLACLVAVAVAHTQYDHQPADAENNLDNAVYGASEHGSSVRTKRSLLLLKKKLLLSALGLKAAKVGAVGVAGALALKKAKSSWSG